MKGVIRKRCPLCSGTIIVSHMMQFSYDHKVDKRNGKVSDRYTRSPIGDLEVDIAACKCGAYWDADSFFIDDGKFFDCKYDVEEG